MSRLPYELVKKLKDAGFPQKWPTNHLCPDSLYDEATGQLEEPLYGSSRSMEDVYKNLVRIPQLSELIEVCGEEFKNLTFLGYGYSFKPWVANSTDTGDAEIKGTDGDTPEEAVARLWLALSRPSN